MSHNRRGKTMIDPREITSGLRDLYVHLDQVVEAKVLPHTEVGCKRGCAYCCYMMTAMGTPEGLLVAEYVLSKPWWKWAARQCRASAKKAVEVGISREKYWELNMPCVFLRKNLCEIYPTRPAACRYYYVMDPISCSQAKAGSLVAALDLTEIEAQVWRYAIDAANDLGFPDIGVVNAPLPIMVLFCMDIMASEKQRPYTRKMVKGLPNPSEWVNSIDPEQLKETLDAEPSESNKATLNAMRKYKII